MARQKEITGPQLDQVSIESGVLECDIPLENWTYKVRRLRADPTIALLRQLFVSPILSAGWTYSAKPDAPEGALEFIEEEFRPIRTSVLRKAAYGCLDHGWAPFEKVLTLRPSGLYGFRKFKQLLHGCTEITADKTTGAFTGFKQDQNYVKLDCALLFNFDVEGTNWYGNAPLRATESSYDRSCVVDDASSAYDEKTSGQTWIIRYPENKKSMVNGELVDNYVLATRIRAALRASGDLILPAGVKQAIQGLNEQSEGWSVELKETAGGAAAAFTERNKYLNTLKARGLGWPERAVLEGTFGTKAEAGEHGDFAMMNVELRHGELVQTLNWHAVNQLLRLNWGESAENTVYIEPQPLRDSSRDWIRTIYAELIKDPETRLQELDAVDMDQLRESVGLPLAEDTEDSPLLTI